MATRKNDPVTMECITYAQLAEKLSEIGVTENDKNLNNKISRGGFTAAFMIQCLVSIGCSSLRVEDD